MRSAAPFVAVLVLLGGCGHDAAPDASDPHQPAYAELALPPEHSLDLLVLIDDSSSTMHYQISLGRALPVLFDALAAGGAMPDLHAGVASSDLGTLDVTTGDPRCASSDQGALLNASCTMVTDPFISDVGGVKNYTGSLSDALACLSRRGSDGCGFEQDLEAVRTALDDNPANVGFLRPDAQLAIVIAADEDDCSAYSPVFFGPDSPQLGALDSFRCFQFGDVCNELDPTVAGPHTGCHSNESSPYLYSVQRYIDYLNALRPGRVSVAAIAGPTAPVEVEMVTPQGGTARPRLKPSCTYTQASPADGTATADAGIRLDQMTHAFGGHGVTYSVCQPDYTDLARDLGNRLHDSLVGQPCLRHALWDSDLEAAGVQSSCDVSVTNIDQAAAPLAACDDARSNPPCWRLVGDAACGAAPADLRLDVVGLSDAPGRHIMARCEVVP